MSIATNRPDRATTLDLAHLGLKVSLVIPAYNEGRNLEWVLSRLPAGLHEVLLVDGDSADDTVEVARRLVPGVKILGQHAPGKGAALAAGLLASTGDVAVMIDADGSMDPAEIPVLVAAIAAGADVVKGSRYLAGGGSHDISIIRSLGNNGLRLLARVVVRKRWSELCYGLAAFRAEVLDQLDLEKIAGGGSMRSTDIELLVSEIPVGEAQEDRGRRPREYGHGFEIETLLFLRSALAGFLVAEVPSFEYARRNGESNLSTFRDGFRVLGAVRHERRRARFNSGKSSPRRLRPATVGAPAGLVATVTATVAAHVTIPAGIAAKRLGG